MNKGLSGKCVIQDCIVACLSKKLYLSERRKSNLLMVALLPGDSLLHILD